MGLIKETYDVGADLTTEDRVLGDHNDESRRTMRRLFVQKYLVKQIKDSKGTTKYEALRQSQAQAGLAGGQHRIGLLYFYEHSRARDRLTHREKELCALGGLRCSLFNLEENVERQGNQYFRPATRQALRR